ncbi:type IV toxin-antitoxin system AbiEi family antitoxin domain-containing protein [Leucobacter luti]|uniref:Uncharacterized protein n=1 Tax=Leucobacter luti TaxID=340320 RepID=A0A4Q7U536_9MICO|nr:type IV toxin-antitoxin system AbiEi family antitoxin domain-containing protein [Leucobacter luti]MBL3701024.1 hypothetical protein [Leucobacter luti]RZT68755.1 hypothetical protein EV139_0483 [Leucobacter luti]
MNHPLNPTARALLTPTQDLIRAGHTGHSLARRVRSGELIRPRRGWYADPDTWREAPAEAKHLAAIWAAQRASRTDPLFAQRSAATLHGLPVWSRWLQSTGVRVAHHDRPATLDNPLATRQFVGPGYRGSRNPHVQYLHESVDLTHTTRIAGLRLTTAERTLFDLARSESFEVALACADQYLRETVRVGALVDMAGWRAWQARLNAMIAAAHGRAGIAQARALSALADPRADSPLESVSRLRFLQLGIDVEPQHPVRSEHGGTLHLDFWLLALAFFGECDGKQKYLDDAFRGGKSAAEVVYAEKRRHDWVTGVTGRRGIRWGAPDVATAARFAARLTAFGVPVPGSPTRRFGPEIRRFLARLPSSGGATFGRGPPSG